MLIYADKTPSTAVADSMYEVFFPKHMISKARPAYKKRGSENTSVGVGGNGAYTPIKPPIYEQSEQRTLFSVAKSEKPPVPEDKQYVTGEIPCIHRHVHRCACLHQNTHYVSPEERDDKVPKHSLYIKKLELVVYKHNNEICTADSYGCV